MKTLIRIGVAFSFLFIAGTSFGQVKPQPELNRTLSRSRQTTAVRSEAIKEKPAPKPVKNGIQAKEQPATLREKSQKATK